MSPRPLPARRSLAVALGLAAWAGACTVEEVDLTGKECPCADGYVCDSATQSCQKPGASGGSSSGGAAGTGGAAGSSGAGGTSTGGTGGSSTGGTGGSGTGGAGTGGTGGSGTGGSGTGGTGGAGTGGAGTGGAGTGGATGAGVTCGAVSCPVATQKCCHADDGTSAAGSCTASATLCLTGFVNMFCDEPGDCGNGKVCCERLSFGGNLNSVQCEASTADCKPLGSGSAALVCNPTSPNCPSGKSCVKTSRGYARCE